MFAEKGLGSQFELYEFTPPFVAAVETDQMNSTSLS